MSNNSRRDFMRSTAAFAATALLPHQSFALSRDFDVRRFGARSDGKASQTAAIQVAIDAAHQSGGGVVYVPEGVYLLDDPVGAGSCLTLRSRVTLRGSSAGTCTLRLNTQFAGGIRVESAAEDVAIEGITYDGQRDRITPHNHPGTGICGSNNVKRFRLADSKIINVWGRSFMSNGEGKLFDDDDGAFASDIVVQNVEVRNAGSKAIQIRKSRNALVDGCIVDANPRDTQLGASAVESSRSIGVTIQDVTARQLRSPLGPGYRIVNDSLDVSVRTCSVHGAREGLVCIDSRRVQFVSLQINGSAIVGGLISSADREKHGLVCEDILVADCNIRAPGHDGIVVNTEMADTGPRNVVVKNCIIDGEGSIMAHGLRVTNAGPVFQKNNIIRNSRSDAIVGDWRDPA